MNKTYKRKDMEKEFTKSDLKLGMVVEYANGDRRLVLSCKKGIFLSGDRYMSAISLSEYSEDFKNSCEALNIDRVYNVKEETLLDKIFDISNLELIWERPKVQEFTLKEIAEKLNIPVEQLRIKE